MCQLGCLDVDPNPAADGVYLDSGVTEGLCFGGEQSDTDGDGLSTFCERALAAAFAPQLYYGAGDRVERESRWAARPLPDGRVRIVYMLGYYFDDGAVVPCSLPYPLQQLICDGHWGDSETIGLDVEFDASTSHWVLKRAELSAHTEYNLYTIHEYPYPNLHYPERVGGYPRVWVAFSKHANYSSDRECDNGGTFDADTCISDTLVRVAAGGSLDVGSRAVHSAAQDCVASSNPLYSTNGVTECYWTNRPFTGWQGMTPSSPSYSSRLSHFGF